MYNLGLSYFHNDEIVAAILNDSSNVFKQRGYEYFNGILDPLSMLVRSYFHEKGIDLGLYALNQGIELACNSWRIIIRGHTSSIGYDKFH